MEHIQHFTSQIFALVINTWHLNMVCARCWIIGLFSVISWEKFGTGIFSWGFKRGEAILKRWRGSVQTSGWSERTDVAASSLSFNWLKHQTCWLAEAILTRGLMATERLVLSVSSGRLRNCALCGVCAGVSFPTLRLPSFMSSVCYRAMERAGPSGAAQSTMLSRAQTFRRFNPVLHLLTIGEEKSVWI